jgi:hypothetical protein
MAIKTLRLVHKCLLKMKTIVNEVFCLLRGVYGEDGMFTCSTFTHNGFRRCIEAWKAPVERYLAYEGNSAEGHNI